MMPLRLFSVFHLNLAYSSIEEAAASGSGPPLLLASAAPLSRAQVSCRNRGLRVHLAEIASIDPGWVKELRQLCFDGLCEFIGSGYSQLIGPLVPAEVNAANLRLGNTVYESLLGHRPRIALVNEQAYSTGLVGHYVERRISGNPHGVGQPAQLPR